ncbi:hypothetical protein [Photobacterium carnosum]|uniref:hypothetical protein n=1 Tax=Photobacterium carnosum TaxID=2023717 RepID=UPI001E65B2D6|nr:hypothetical protein [Photobacterium carnosum]MCD9516842.1 hypothetical protein [Photobacterium carnosum]
MSASYSIRIDFDKDEDRPERVFLAMAAYVEGFNELQEAFIKGYDKNIEFISSLNSTREGSCIADIGATIKEKIRNVNMNIIFDGIYNGVRKEIAKADKIDAKSDVQEFVDNVYTIAANQNMAKPFTCEGGANLIDVTNALNKIYKAKGILSPNDLVQFGRGLDFDNISENFSCPRTGEQIFEDTIVSFPSKELFIVRRPSYVENLQWDFECSERKPKNFSAKMLDKKWFNKWLNHEKEIWPGDALYVLVTTKRKVNLSKKRVSYETEIIKVLRVIPHNDIEQFQLEFWQNEKL